MRSQIASPRRLIIPILMVIVFAGIALFDYSKQHTKIHLLGSTLDIANIQQIIVEPNGDVSGTSQSYYKITDQKQIIALCNLLSSANRYRGNEGDFAKDIDNILVESSNKITQIPVAQTSTNDILIFYQGKSYQAPQNFVKSMYKIASQGPTKN